MEAAIKQVVGTGCRETCLECMGTGAMWPKDWSRPLQYEDIKIDCRGCGGKGSVLVHDWWAPERV